jgi:Trk K+ transport system NAD-binding subunit
LIGPVLDTKILKQAGVENMQAVILALNTDSTTLFTTVIVKDLAPDVPVIARVNRAENVERIYAAGADFAVSISQVSGQLLAWRQLGKESVAVSRAARDQSLDSRLGKIPSEPSRYSHQDRLLHRRRRARRRSAGGVRR